jgi:glycosyltransferase involved in cell wall biosynthesis
MKLVILAGTLGKGGAERQIYYLSNLVKNKGYEVTVLCLTQDEYYEHLIKNNGIEVVFVGKSPNNFKRLFTIFKDVKKLKPNVLYSFHFFTGFYAGVVGRLLRIRSISSIRNDGFSEKKYNGWFSWLHFSTPDEIVANSSHGLKNSSKAFYKKKISLLPNIIDLEYFSYQPKKTDNTLNLLFIGRLVEAKRPWLFIDLVENLKNKGFKISANIIGKGVLEEELKRKANGLPIEFLGIKDDVRSYLYLSDVLISTSAHEGTPNVMLEAMSCGILISALFHEGLQDWSEKELLNKNNNFNDLVEDVIRIYKNSEDRKKTQLDKNRKYVEDFHSEINVFRSFNKILN